MAVYKVPLVSSNLHPQEMILQIADTLDHLDRVSNEIFSRASSRIQESRSRIQKINQRVEAAQIKISSMTGSRKATRIFSSSRFPGSLQSKVPKLFPEEEGITFIKSEADHHNTTESPPPNNDLIFYPSNYNPGTFGMIPSTPPPPDSVSEMLIFNSEDLAMFGGSITDRAMNQNKLATRKKHDSAETDSGLLGDAPWSISQREHLEQVNPLHYAYIPGILKSHYIKLI